MPLHLAHHKSYHPYNRDNIARVRRDEEQVRQHEEATDSALRAMDRSARVEELRKRKREADNGPDPEQAMPPAHINFWAEYEAKHAPTHVPEGAPFGAKTTEWYAQPRAAPSAKDTEAKASSDPLNAMNAYLYEKERRSKEQFFREPEHERERERERERRHDRHRKHRERRRRHERHHHERHRHERHRHELHHHERRHLES